MSTPHPRRKLILIVDDEREIRNLVQRYLDREGFAVIGAGDGAEMQDVLSKRLPDLVIMDIRLPGDDGVSLTRQLRSTSRIPIIMLTSKKEVADRVTGLESGADDYLTKPFDLRELLARVQALLRRAEEGRTTGTASRGVLCFSGWELDISQRELRGADERKIPLSTAEFDLLRVLVENANKVLNRDFLLQVTRGRSTMPFDRTIDVRIGHLRRHLLTGHGDGKQLIKTVRGAGYMLASEVHYRDPAD
ncbi:MAG: response regulator transcription factor [Arenicellales bacterium]|nr:response regulator transcription factor [Arenicellales bacterium]MDP6552964.1 response regulator transcription factor [Arenicellales bacterium]MDP6791142.1 response regulator transcription factor [Arenicellales bacterium]MDP6918858.1 response regulator transcription factor [Arenicellales bacterium]